MRVWDRPGDLPLLLLIWVSFPSTSSPLFFLLSPFPVVFSLAQGFSLPCVAFFFFLSSPRLNVPVVSAPETESILRSRNQTAELSLSPDVGGHTDAEPSGYLTPREWPCRVISLTLGA